jgi:hypothetical protein
MSTYDDVYMCYGVHIPFWYPQTRCISSYDVYTCYGSHMWYVIIYSLYVLCRHMTATCVRYGVHMCYVVNMCYGVYNIALWRILRVMTASCAMSSYKVYMCYQRYVVICRLHVLWRLPHCTMTSTHVLWRLHMYYDVYTCVMTSTHVLWPYLCYIIFCNGVL